MVAAEHLDPRFGLTEEEGDMALRRAQVAREDEEITLSRLLDDSDLLAPGEAGPCVEFPRRRGACLLQAMADEHRARPSMPFSPCRQLQIPPPPQLAETSFVDDCQTDSGGIIRQAPSSTYVKTDCLWATSSGIGA